VLQNGRIYQQGSFPCIYNTLDICDLFFVFRFHHCAVREVFEEVGVALTTPILSLEQDKRRQWRTKVMQDPKSFNKLLKEQHCLPALDELIPFGNWITPLELPHRFDTWFFLTILPEDHKQHVETLPNCTELDELLWMDPDEALDQYRHEVYNFAPPQLYLLHELQKCKHLDDIRDLAIQKSVDISPNLPQRHENVICTSNTLSFVLHRLE